MMWAFLAGGGTFMVGVSLGHVITMGSQRQNRDATANRKDIP